MSKKMQWKPDMEEAIRKIIQSSISASGTIKPDDLPHLVRAQLSSQISGDIDIDQYIKSTLEKMKKAGEI